MAAGVAQAAGTMISGLQANAQGRYEAQVDKRNAQLSREAALESIATGSRERRDYWRKVGSVKGSQVAAMAANNIDVGFGAAERLQADTELLARDDAENLYHNEAQRTRGFAIEALNYRNSAKAKKSAGRAALVSSAVSAAGTLMTAAQQGKLFRPRA